MLTYTQLLDKYKLFTIDKTTENATFGANQLNSSIKKRVGEADFIFLEKGVTDTTVANQQSYPLPADLDQMRAMTVTQGSTVWSLLEAPSRQYWNLLNTVTYTSDIAQYYYIIGNQVLVYPIPSSNGNTISYNYKKRIPVLNTADYTTGTIAITSGDETVTGTATTFTASMVGRSLITSDGLWYPIATFTSTTSLELETAYMGATITGATYTIGQMSPMPDAYDDLPVYDAAADYYTMKGNFKKAEGYRELADTLTKKMREEQGAKSTSPRITSTDSGVINPNLFVRL